MKTSHRSNALEFSARILATNFEEEVSPNVSRVSRSTVLRYKRDRAQPGNIFTGQKSAWVRSRATDNRSDPTMFVHPACLQRSAAAAERLSTFDNRRIYRSICRSPLEFAVAHDSRNRARGKRIEGEQRCLKRDRERKRVSPTTRWNVAPVSACRFLFTYRYVALLGDTFRQIHQATFLPL